MGLTTSATVAHTVTSVGPYALRNLRPGAERATSRRRHGSARGDQGLKAGSGDAGGREGTEDDGWMVMPPPVHRFRKSPEGTSSCRGPGRAAPPPAGP